MGKGSVTQVDIMEEQKLPPLEVEPRWPVVVALLTVSGLYAALPVSLAVIPQWYLLIIVPARAHPPGALSRPS